MEQHHGDINSKFQTKCRHAFHNDRKIVTLTMQYVSSHKKDYELLNVGIVR